MDVSSWGRYPSTQQNCHPVFWRHQQAYPNHAEGSVLPFGMGRSYGDVCLNDGANLLLTRHLDRLIDFQPESGILRAEAGISLGEVLAFSLPRGWFPPVTPGTKYVTLGGMVANDVHGKNHHRDGSFGHHILSFGLWRTEAGHMQCSPHQNSDLFKATIGGLGLTGLITDVSFQMMPVHGAGIASESYRFRGLDRFLELSQSSDRDFRYTVAWLDTSQLKTGNCRGIFFRGNHSQTNMTLRHRQAWRLPVRAPKFALNRTTLSLFNRLYYYLHPKQKTTHNQYFDPFFYPLDRVLNWNLLYGQRGPLQYQCVVPNPAALQTLFERVAQSKEVSFLTVLKQFGQHEPVGYLSFPRSGFTLAMDFQISPSVFELFDQLDGCVLESGGAVYPAKDAHMSAKHFQAFFPNWPKWHRWIDPQFSSSFLRRVLPNQIGDDKS